MGDEIVAVYNIDGTFYATRRAAPMPPPISPMASWGRDRVQPALGAFHVPTGKAVQAPCFIDLKTFHTEVKDGQVLVDLEAPAATAT